MSKLSDQDHMTTKELIETLNYWIKANHASNDPMSGNYDPNIRRDTDILRTAVARLRSADKTMARGLPTHTSRADGMLVTEYALRKWRTGRADD